MLRRSLLGLHLLFLTTFFTFASTHDYSQQEDAEHHYRVTINHKIIKNPRLFGAASAAEFGTGLLRTVHIQAPEHVYFEIHTAKSILLSFNYPFRNIVEFYPLDDIRIPYSSMNLYINDKVLARFMEYFRTSPFIYDNNDLMEQMTSKISTNYQVINQILGTNEHFSENLVSDIMNHPTTAKLSFEQRCELAKRAKEIITFKKRRISLGRERIAQKRAFGLYSYSKMGTLLTKALQEAELDQSIDSHVWFYQASEGYKYLNSDEETLLRFWQATPAGKRSESMSPKFVKEMANVLDYYRPLTLVHEPYGTIFLQHPFFSSYRHNCATAAVEGIRNLLDEPNFYAIKFIPINGREFVHRFNETVRHLTKS